MEQNNQLLEALKSSVLLLRKLREDIDKKLLTQLSYEDYIDLDNKSVEIRNHVIRVQKLIDKTA